jgi:hypothetical protein
LSLITTRLLSRRVHSTAQLGLSDGAVLFATREEPENGIDDGAAEGFVDAMLA